EVRHARLAFDVVSAWGDGPARPGGLPLDGALGAVERSAWLVETIRGGCVAETISAMHVAEMARRVRDPDLAQALRAVADDEARHAELAWAAVRWCVRDDPSLASVAQATFDALTEPPLPPQDPDADRLAAHGVLSARDQAAIAAHVLDRVIRPCAALVVAC
ncbi:MAG: ferritin-like domain-containing protein, partial [Myxococcota bacterium]